MTRLRCRCQWTIDLFSADNGRPRAPPYGIAATRPGCDACRGQKTVPKCQTGEVFRMPHMDKMYRHVATYHLDLAQLWRCPVSWCTVWKGTPQDCMVHVLGVHDVPREVKSASLEKFVPPWTVRRQVWSDSLAANHSGISTDVLLFSDINLSLTHHYRVHKCGLPGMAFRKNYLTLRVSVSQAAGQSRHDTTYPAASSPVSTRHARSAERESETSRLTRRGRRRLRPVRILEESVSDLPTLTVQDPSHLQDALVYDCRPPLLPVSLRFDDIGPLPLRRTVVSASLAAPPQEDVMEIAGVSPEEIAFPELGVAPLFDTDTELEDELPTPEVSPLFHDSSPQGVRLPQVCPAPRDIVDVELENTLLSVSILPAMVTPLEEPVEVFPVAPSLYPEPPVPVLPNDDPGAPSRVSALRVAADQPVLDLFPSYSNSLACSVYEPVTSPLMPSLQEDDDYRPPPSPATMDQYLSSDGDLLLGGAVDLPLLSMPLTPRPVIADMVPESSVGSPAGLPVVSPSDGMPDLSQKGPFDVH